MHCKPNSELRLAAVRGMLSFGAEVNHRNPGLKFSHDISESLYPDVHELHDRAATTYQHFEEESARPSSLPMPLTDSHRWGALDRIRGK